jgi:hypothetical protein
LPNFFFGKFGSDNFLALRMPILFYAVEDVIEMSAKKKMVWINAKPIVTSVTNKQTFWDWSLKMSVRKSVCHPIKATTANNGTLMVFVFLASDNGRCPKPTTAVWFGNITFVKRIDRSPRANSALSIPNVKRFIETDSHGLFSAIPVVEPLHLGRENETNRVQNPDRDQRSRNRNHESPQGDGHCLAPYALRIKKIPWPVRATGSLGETENPNGDQFGNDKERENDVREGHHGAVPCSELTSRCSIWASLLLRGAT